MANKLKTSYVYQLRVKYQRKPFYIGKGFGNRALVHFESNSLKSKSHKNNIIKKALREGLDVFIEYLATNLTDKQACKLEMKYIKLYGRRDLDSGCLANLTDGGDGPAGYVFTEEQRRRKSEAAKGRIVTEETREKISIANTGIIWSDDSRKQASIDRKGRRRSWKSRLQQSVRQSGKQHSEEWNRNISLGQLGKVMSKEARDKMSASKIMPIAEVKSLLSTNNPDFKYVSGYVKAAGTAIFKHLPTRTLHTLNVYKLMHGVLPQSVRRLIRE